METPIRHKLENRVMLLEKENMRLKSELESSRSPGCSTAKYERARQAYVKLTNSGNTQDIDTGEIFYCADSEIMAALDEFFGSR